jgi:hypothetical protein
MSSQILRRYTALPQLFHMLATKTITLLSPESWDDRNDASYLERYKQRKQLKSVLALCFTAAPEQYHHWKVFAPGPSGVRIEFDGARLLEQILRAEPTIRPEPVIYKKIGEIRTDRPKRDELPFIKRYPFRDEMEFRIVYEDSEAVLQAKDIPFQLSAIRRIVLSPWLPAAMVPTVKKIIRGFDEHSELKVTRTTLVQNDEWQRCAVEEPPHASV